MARSLQLGTLGAGICVSNDQAGVFDAENLLEGSEGLEADLD